MSDNTNLRTYVDCAGYTDGTKRYATGWRGRLSVIELIFSLVAFFCVATTDRCRQPAQGFFCFITLVGCIASFFPVCLRLLGYRMANLSMWLKLEFASFVIFLIIFLFCLIFASLDACTDAWTAGLVFGWFAIVIFSIDAAYTVQALKALQQTEPVDSPIPEQPKEPRPNPDQGIYTIPLTQASELPSHWAPMRVGWPFLPVALNSNDSEYQTVVKHFAQPSVQIVKIERIQNPFLYRQYMLHKREMDAAFIVNLPMNEQRLWHGTAGANVTNINTTNFNRSYSGQHAVAFGSGVYFAVSSNYSVRRGYCPRDAHSLRYIYQARVLTGMSAQGAEGMREPPMMSGLNTRYDSVVDDVETPNMFVVFHDAQCYPEYLITFR